MVGLAQAYAKAHSIPSFNKCCCCTHISSPPVSRICKPCVDVVVIVVRAVVALKKCDLGR